MGFVVILIIGAVFFIRWAMQYFASDDDSSGIYNTIYDDPFTHKPRFRNVEDIRRYEYYEQLQNDRNAVRARIQDKIEDIRNDSTKPEDMKQVYIDGYQRILSKPMRNFEEISDAEWEFNDGSLRTHGDVYAYSGEYADDCKTRTTLICVIAFLLGFLPIEFLLLLDSSDGSFLAFIVCAVPATIVGLIFALIASMISHAVNAHIGSNLKSEYADKTVRSEKIAFGISALALAGSLIHIGKKTKNAAKDFANVDGWNKMK